MEQSTLNHLLEQGANPQASLQQMLSDNPRAQAIFHLLNAQNQGDEQQEHHEETQQKLIRQNKHLIKMLKKAQHEIKRLGQEIQQLEGGFQFFLEINDNLAAATGACSECWGLIETCQACQGDGAPGAFVPDMEAFNHFILPAIKVLKQKKSHTHRAPSPHQHPERVADENHQ